MSDTIRDPFNAGRDHNESAESLVSKTPSPARPPGDTER